jgi:RNA polymerase primary sigma factor
MIAYQPTVEIVARRRSTTPARRAQTGNRVAARNAEANLPASSKTSATPESGIEVPRTSQPEPVETSRYESKNALSLYLKDAVEVPLLTVEEEIELAARIKKGDEAARERMIRANMRLVVKIARDYDGFGVPLLDLISEGNIGLMKGVDRFDPSKGGKLSTYASWWIKQQIKRALANQSKTIRLPVHLVDKIARMKRVATELREQLGREPSDEELAGELATPVRKIRSWQRAAQRTISLDAPIGDDDSSVLADVVADPQNGDPGEEMETSARHLMVRKFLEILDSRELSILQERFGMNGQKEKTLDEIGRRFGVTRERIRQLQNIALEKLRNQIENYEAVQMPVS